ncbi:MAG: hypothetical protein A2Z34_00115 [Planctomycetes bacterium RBG_16_59_8]|nr:MAG: hypothetical protein A2Z34_00115 [Planctomycetes bacterium RBG_16_59_8]
MRRNMHASNDAPGETGKAIADQTNPGIVEWFLIGVVALASAWVVVQGLWYVPGYIELFRQLKLELPVLTRLIMSHYVAMSAAAAFIALANLCSPFLFGMRRNAVVIMVVFSLMLLGLVALVMYWGLELPLIRIQEQLTE